MSGEGHGYYTKDILSAWHSATPIFPDGKEEWIDDGDILYFSEDYGYTFLLSRLLWKSTFGPRYLLLTCETFTTE